MADAVTSQKIIDGPKKVVYKFTNISDGTGEAAVLKVDVSGLSGAPGTVKITKIQYEIVGMSVQLLWDATTDVVILVMQSAGYLDFTHFGGIPNTLASGYTGDILLTTTGHTAGDTYTIILEMEKS